MTHKPIIPLAAQDPYRKFSLIIEHASISLLPADHELQVHESGRFSVVHQSTGCPCQQGIFTQEALPVILVLLDHWPSYVQNQKLLHALKNVNASDGNPCFGNEKQNLDRMNHLINASRPTFQSIGIDIQAISELGHKLGKYTEPKTDHQE